MGVEITGRITTVAESDVFATHDGNRGALGFHSVNSLIERNQISYDRRRGTYQGDLDSPKPFFVSVRIVDEVKLYWLKNEPGTEETTDSDWEEFIAGYEEPFQGFFIPNSTTLEDGTGSKGNYWIASEGGTFNGETYVAYDKTIYDGSVWKKIGGGTVVADWTTMLNKPSEFTPTTHNHPISEVTNLQTTLDNKLDSSQLIQTVLPVNNKVPSSQAVVDFTYSKSEVNVILSNLSTYGIKYAWLNSTQMLSQTGMVGGDLGLRQDEKKVYKWSGTAWQYFFTIESNIPLATSTNDGLMSKEDKASLGINNTRSALNAFTLGDTNTASGINSTAIGNNSISSSTNTVASGQNCQAIAHSAHAFGYLAKAIGAYSFASNLNTNATGLASSSEGWHTTASGNYGSHAEGDSSIASGVTSHVQNYHCRAIGDSSHAGGVRAKAVGGGSFNHSTNSTLHPDVNKGAVGDNSVVLGGRNGSTTVEAIDSVVLGGNSLVNSRPNTVLVPELIVYNGLITNAAGDNILTGIHENTEEFYNPSVEAQAFYGSVPLTLKQALDMIGVALANGTTPPSTTVCPIENFTATVTSDTEITLDWNIANCELGDVEPISSFTATTVSDTQINLTWEEPI